MVVDMHICKTSFHRKHNYAKLKQGILIGPQIRKSMEDEMFEENIQTVELTA